MQPEREFPGVSAPGCKRKGLAALIPVWRYKTNAGANAPWYFSICPLRPAIGGLYSQMKNAPLWEHLFCLAERVGFEPTVQCNPYDDLANRSFRPLRHLSVF